MNKTKCDVSAFWDESAQVWTAESETVPGLATEAETLEGLTQKLRTLVPELLQLNCMIEDVSLTLHFPRRKGILGSSTYLKIA